MFHANAKPRLMGILNVTPDSFSDGGRFTGLAAAIRQAETMLEEGADIIDIGGESTRPGSEPVSADEQIRRVVPAIGAIAKLGRPVTISIDTMLAPVAAAALDAGAEWINDVSGGLGDPCMLDLAAERGASIILMHMQGTPKTMQDAPHYQDVVGEVETFLKQRVDAALAAGIPRENIAIDPGIGFGKRKQDNLALLAHLDRFVALGWPVLLGTSRKRFMGGICNVEQPAELVTATAVTTALGVMAGVQLFRVHDVKANRQALDVAWAIKQAR
ncbi:dihydropteroate synthase [Methylomonas sp. MS20]|uniref:dihydropteroate synthase n=1 Tax=unclassified Methylomonas TaxID=2608980 RepID=UPI0028A369B5|nr:dihydropteroate synthase [Methylomonas sp. MV1]MDT4331616.1 dihydropteroate synthase [Methylomonas sp. MV1]